MFVFTHSCCISFYSLWDTHFSGKLMLHFMSVAFPVSLPLCDFMIAQNFPAHLCHKLFANTTQNAAILETHTQPFFLKWKLRDLLHSICFWFNFTQILTSNAVNSVSPPTTDASQSESLQVNNQAAVLYCTSYT